MIIFSKLVLTNVFFFSENYKVLIFSTYIIRNTREMYGFFLLIDFLMSIVYFPMFLMDLIFFFFEFMRNISRLSCEFILVFVNRFFAVFNTNISRRIPNHYFSHTCWYLYLYIIHFNVCA